MKVRKSISSLLCADKRSVPAVCSQVVNDEMNGSFYYPSKSAARVNL